MIVFLEASALVKRYVKETGSASVATHLRSDVVTISRLAIVEVLVVFLAILAGSLPLTAAPLTSVPDVFDQLEFRRIGPVGNRVPAVLGVPGDLSTYYAGAASGGIWKSTDGGVRWEPIFDDQEVSSIGSLAVAPSDRNVVWAGTGETFIRSNVSIGNGIYRSTDAGETWQHRGLERTGRIGRIVVHPRDSDLVFAAALGNGYGPQPERGLYRTRDGGETWEQVLFVDQHTGAIDLVMDPTNPRILYAATWQFQMRTSGRTSGGPGSGIYKSKDGGDTWTKIGPQTPEEHSKKPNGTPKGPWGKIGLTVSADVPKRIYALIETNSNADFAPVEGWDGPGYQGVLWRSDDGGESWSLVSRDNTLHQRPLYYTRMMAAPDNANEITFMAVDQSFSIDGGRTIERQNSGWDHHDIWIDPLVPERRITGHDGGVSISLDRGKSWFRPQLPVAQLYHVNVDDQVPYFVYGNRQDGPSMKGPSNTLTGGGIPMSLWQSVGGCEVGFAVPTPGNPDIVWTGCYDGILERYDATSGHARDVSVKPLAIESWPGIDLEYRFQWSFPIEISPHDPELVYVGSQYVHQTTDGGDSWAVISPDLSTGDQELMLRTGGLTLDDAGPTIAAVVFAIAESHLEKGQIWAGTNDGKLHLTRDAGETWTDLSGNLPGVPPLGTISNVEPSRHDPAHAYVTVDRHQEGDTATYVMKTEDRGRTWRSLRANIPQDTFAYAHCIKEDPEVPGLLYLGTHNALRVSFDDGRSWTKLSANLPPAPVSWIEVQEHFGDLVLSTYGRGFFILDDLSPLRFAARQLQGESNSDIALVPPRSVYRFRGVEATMSVPDVPADGTDPRYGVPLHYWLPYGAEADTKTGGDSATVESVKIEITDAHGTVVRTLEDQSKDPGLHRLWWDLAGESTERPKRTLPPRDDPKGKAGLDAGTFSILQPPGEYTVRLIVSFESEAEDSAKPSQKKPPKGSTSTTQPERSSKRTVEQPLVVLQDPRSRATRDEIAEQIELLESLRADIDRSGKMINQIETLRTQVGSWSERVAAEKESLKSESSKSEQAKPPGRGSRAPSPTPERLDALETQLTEVTTELENIEDQLVDLRLTAARQDSLRWQRRLHAQLQYLAWRIHKTDDAPNVAQKALAAELSSQLQELVDRRQRLDQEIVVLNEAIGSSGLQDIGVTK